MDLFGAQVEAQIGASLYKKTTSAGGIYPNTRFGDDGLEFSTLGPGPAWLRHPSSDLVDRNSRLTREAERQ